MTSTTFRSTLSYAELIKRDPRPSRPKQLLFDNNDSELENTMTDSATAGTPPLDLTSDSGEEDETEHSSSVAMCSPVSPSTFQPVSILLHHNRKRKDSQEEHVSALSLFDRQRGQHDDEYAAHPAPQGYGKGARGRRPTVTFDLDDEHPTVPLSPSAVHPYYRHDDDDVNHSHRATDIKADDNGDHPDKKTHQATTTSEVPDTALVAAEQALRRVSITSPVHDRKLSAPQDPEATTNLATTTTPAATSITTSSSSSSSVVENSAPPQEIILNHITADPVPQDLLVALYDRSSELETLAAIHSDFFNLIYSSLSKTSRESFKTLLFTSRSSLGDRDWMAAIDNHLSALPPCILEKLKGIVGWIGPDGDYDDDDNDNVLWGEDEYGYRDSSFEQVQIKWLRDVPGFPLETFKQRYPQFFVNARERLQGRRMSHGGDPRDQYEIFCETLALSRDDLPCDNAWTRRMNGCLEKHPELLLQLKEIIAYETGYDD
ncbi:hypothetical protein BGX29_006513 [Mortierella sp. GBA35]|nr:hypothetical protein BGX29_006513 [Mortierella sp. GBA35]